MANKPDVIVTGKFPDTVYMFEPCTRKAKTWLKKNVTIESWQWLGNAFGVECRYTEDLVDVVRGAGLSVEWRQE